MAYRVSSDFARGLSGFIAYRLINGSGSGGRRGGGSPKGGCGCLSIMIIIIVALGFGALIDSEYWPIAILILSIIVIGVIVAVVSNHKSKTDATTVNSQPVHEIYPNTVSSTHTYPAPIFPINFTSKVSPNLNPGFLPTDFEELIKKYQVPEGYRKIFVAHSSYYGIKNCPMVIWCDLKSLHLLTVEKEPRKYVWHRSWVEIEKFEEPQPWEINHTELSEYLCREFADYCADKNFDYKLVNLHFEGSIAPGYRAFMYLNEISMRNVLAVLGLSSDLVPDLDSEDDD